MILCVSTSNSVLRVTITFKQRSNYRKTSVGPNAEGVRVEAPKVWGGVSFSPQGEGKFFQFRHKMLQFCAF